MSGILTLKVMVSLKMRSHLGYQPKKNQSPSKVCFRLEAQDINTLQEVISTRSRYYCSVKEN